MAKIKQTRHAEILLVNTKSLSTLLHSISNMVGETFTFCDLWWCYC